MEFLVDLIKKVEIFIEKIIINLLPKDYDEKFFHKYISSILFQYFLNYEF